MPLAVKDNICTKGIKTSCASLMLDNFHPQYTATVVQRLFGAGMLLVGKTNLDSFGMGSSTVDSTIGPTKNPWTSKSTETSLDDGDFRIAGGSSGGSAAAVASGIVYGALGSDTGGSVRNPAAYCGIVGMRPTYGLFSRHGLIPLTNSTESIGILTQTVEQCTHMLNAVAGHDPLDSTTYHDRKFEKVKLAAEPSVKGLRIGIPQEFHIRGTSEEVIDTWSQIADNLEKEGAIVKEVTLPHLSYTIACYAIINYCDVASNMARYDGIEYGHRADREESTEALFAQTRHEAFNNVVRSRIFAGNYFLLRNNYDQYYVKAAKVRRLIYKDFLKSFNDVDLLLTPVTMSDAPLHSQLSHLDNRRQCEMQDFYTLPANLTGVPAVSVPIKLSDNGLPLSLQLIGRHFDEELLLNTALFLERHCNFPYLVRPVWS
ncbi:glutamyl-tRNA(Gln) amidotransferase subunit A, mitochondrial-like [Watersipora subatra]|uniref:glutamyl-tRNA(Gln) amidotransferase subunit A, mitochondrial-like n=1 Tax=Watersipora subatra TaxID=2589382 RepID=UPI00355B64EF